MMTAASPGRTSTALTGAVGFLVVMELGSGMLQGWYPVLLSAIGTEFRVSAAQLNWVSAIYLLATVVFVPIIAKFGDIYGHKRLLAVAASLVAFGSIIVAIAPDFTWLLVGRALQAPLAAFLPLEFAIVRDRNEKAAGRSIGKLVGALTFGAALGALGAGLLYNAIGDLRTVLWMPAIFLALCVPVVIFLVPESRARKSGSIDWVGASLLGVGLLLALGGVSNASTWGWTDIKTLLAIGVGVVLLIAWVQVEKRVAHPLVDIDLLTRGGIGLPIIMAFLFGAQLFGSQTASTVFLLSNPSALGFGLGATPATVGVLSLVAALAAFVAATFGDRLAGRFGSRLTLAIGGALIAVCYGLIIAGSSSLAMFVAAMTIGGVGNGILIAVLPTLVVKRAPADSVGIASALYNTARTAAGGVAGAIFALVMASFLTTVTVAGAKTTTSSFTAYVAVWAICAAIGITLVILAAFVKEPASSSDAAGSPAQSTAVITTTIPNIATGEPA
jgi:MFS family permease